MFSTWFQLGPIPSNVLIGHYNLELVALSYIVAVLASYVALDFVGRLQVEKNPRATLYWILGGAFAMGAGIWSMHFVGMLAFVLPMPMDYSFGWTAASLLIAILSAAFALYIIYTKSNSFLNLSIGGLVIGLAISAMHYSGMQGMKDHVGIHYLPDLFFTSILIGILAAEAAIWLLIQSNKGSVKRQFYFKSFSALIMGIAICGMHYTAMEAAVFTPLPNHIHGMAMSGISTKYLAFFVAGIAALIISLALIASSYYRKMVNAISNEKEFLNAMLDNLEDGIIACDGEEKITVLNQALKKYLNLNSPHLIIDHLLDYFTLTTTDNVEIGRDDFPLKLVLKGETIKNVPYVMRSKYNITRDVIIDGQRIINAENKNIGAVIVIHDVTELKQTEKLKNEFVSIVSHELRTPLTSIRGSLGLLVSGVLGEFPEKATKLLQIANNNCERLLILINDILDIEKIEAGKMDFDLKTVPIEKVIMDAVEANKMYAEKFKTYIDFVPPKESINVRIDYDRLMQVLTNLISNACKFSPKGEPVTVSIKKVKDMIKVSVSDKGPGIPEKFQSRIFQKFSQADSSDSRRKGGTGLGLNISKTIIERLGGALNFVTSSKGTTFFFKLPIEEKIKRTQARKEISHSAKRLLICEDDHYQSEYLKILLESSGFTLDVAHNVIEAKQLLEKHHYQALLLDLILPDQDGISFIRELRQNPKTRDLNIIVISVIAETGKSLLNGDAFTVLDWLDKPIDFRSLLHSINRIKKFNSNRHPEILHIEDNPDTRHVVQTLVEEHANMSSASTLEEAKRMLEEKQYDLVILDLLLPDGNGIEILPLLAKYRTPILVFSDMKLNGEYAKFVNESLVKSTSSNEMLLNTIMSLI